MTKERFISENFNTSIEIRSQKNPLATITHINWPSMLGVMSEGRTPQLKKVTIQGENIRSYEDLISLGNKVDDQEISIGLYSPTKKEITIYVDRILAGWYFKCLGDGFLREVDSGVLLVPEEIYQEATERVFSTLVHEGEHSLQKRFINPKLGYLFGWSLLPGFFAHAINYDIPHPELLNVAAGLSVFGSWSYALTIFMRNAWVPYNKRAHEVEARARVERMVTHYQGWSSSYPFTLKVDWKRLGQINEEFLLSP